VTNINGSPAGGRWLQPREGVALCGVTVQTLAAWADAGKLTSIRTPGGQRRYRESDLLIIRAARIVRFLQRLTPMGALAAAFSAQTLAWLSEAGVVVSRPLMVDEQLVGEWVSLTPAGHEALRTRVAGVAA
jgi:hypothetical protein